RSVPGRLAPGPAPQPDRRSARHFAPPVGWHKPPAASRRAPRTQGSAGKVVQNDVPWLKLCGRIAIPCIRRLQAPCRPRPSALDDVDRQPTAAGLLVLVAHVAAGVAHGPDDLVEADLVLAFAAHRHARGVD